MNSSSAPASLSLALALGLWSAAASPPNPNAPLLTTITNPTPANYDIFGSALAAMGNDRVLIGSEGANEAYLFTLNGTLLTTFSIPDIRAGSFGAALATVGGNRVVIGAYNYSAGTPPKQTGRAYLFATNGTLLATFTNPAPESVQAFGFSVAALGDDHVLIGTGGGGPFLFRTNGALETTFTKPGSGTFGSYGTCATAAGTDRLLIGAPFDPTGAAGAGTAYLFATNGTLLTTFTNPVPATGDNFGTSVAVVGTDRLLISAIDYGGTKGTGGAAYLFSTNGTLLTTFTNPTPAAGDYFGWSVAAVGRTRVLIGAYQDGTTAFQAGSAYLFDTNGTLLTTIANPAPASQSWFGWSVAAAGNDHLIIGGVWNNTGAFRAGSAYVYALPYPPLSISRTADTVSIGWISPETGLTLQQTDLLGAAAAWGNTTGSVSVYGPTNVVREAITNGFPARFYRLARP